jgi:uncharacterized protein (TIGR00369 family)
MPTPRALNPDYLDALYELINTSPFPRHLPMRITNLGWDTSTIVLDVEPNHLQPFGIVHGGVIATLIDTATFWAGFGSLAPDAGLVNVDLKLNYLQAVSAGTLVAQGRAIRLGRTLSYTEATVTGADGALVAHGTSTLMALPGKGLPLRVAKFV